MSKIYIVTSGDYSDYSINAVYDTKEKAEAAIAPFTGYEIEEYELNPSLPDYIKPGEKFYDITMLSDGEIPIYYDSSDDWYYRQVDLGFNDYDQKFEMEFQLFAYPSFGPDATNKNPDRYGEWVINGIIRARDEQHAIKIMNERRIQILANNDWPAKVTKWCKEPESNTLQFNGNWPEGFIYHQGYPHIHGKGLHGAMDLPKMPDKYNFGPALRETE